MQKSLLYGLFAVVMLSGYAHGMQFVSGAPVGICTSFATMYALGYTKGVVEKMPALANVLPYAKWISVATGLFSGYSEYKALAKWLRDENRAAATPSQTLFMLAQNVLCNALPSFLVGVGGIALCNKLAAK